MIRVSGESLSVPWMAGPIVGNRPPLATLRISLSIRHSDELACGAGLLTRRVDWARFGRHRRQLPSSHDAADDIQLSIHPPTRFRHGDGICMYAALAR